MASDTRSRPIGTTRFVSRWAGCCCCQGKPAEAEAVFREDLDRTPANPWSLHGLAESLRAQKAEEAVKVERRFREAWSQADLQFEPSRFDAFLAVTSR